MNRKYRRLSAAALALLFCLTAVPVIAKPVRDRDRFESREPIVRVIKKIKGFLDRLTTHDEPTPPHPKP